MLFLSFVFRLSTCIFVFLDFVHCPGIECRCPFFFSPALNAGFFVYYPGIGCRSFKSPAKIHIIFYMCNTLCIFFVFFSHLPPFSPSISPALNAGNGSQSRFSFVRCPACYAGFPSRLKVAPISLLCCSLVGSWSRRTPVVPSPKDTPNIPQGYPKDNRPNSPTTHLYYIIL